MILVAVVGMCGAGKSVAADMLAEKGFGFIRLGQLTLDIVKQRGLEPTEENERPIREELRKQHGMAAYATLNFPKIDSLLQKGDVVIDGLYSWEEYLEFKKMYRESLIVLAVYASPKIRYRRLSARRYDPKKDRDMRNRPSSAEAAKSRDHAQIENLHTAGPIAMADHTIINEGSIDELRQKFEEFYTLISGRT